ncbi:hypothetical protein GETHPA_18070 [Geothrix rubra]|uniref:Cupin type-2 domain-containing protein n=1 Tax=Geothrix rubra TaxID=2927977 RepID=A0ABQ5Q7I0_9BACT|nr:cupin domain-containing protein [Geothrix rubra]GLH70274.1 hypothetical protein GETHPA_18070 [Geothrix rubra]
MRIDALRDLPVTPLGPGTAIEKCLLVGPGVVPHLQQFVRATFQPGQVAPVHAHADWTEVFYIESGAGTLTVEGTSHALRPGVTFRVDPGEHHEITSAPDSELVVVYVSVKA